MRVAHCVDQGVRLDERQFHDGRRLIGSGQRGLDLGNRLSLVFAITLTHMGSRMSTRRYHFTIVRNGETTEKVLAWHWHPESRQSHVETPHLHLPAKSPFQSSHVPTGRMCLEDIVLYAFSELGVTPTVPNGQAIVEDARETHKKYRQWH